MFEGKGTVGLYGPRACAFLLPCRGVPKARDLSEAHYSCSLEGFQTPLVTRLSPATP